MKLKNAWDRVQANDLPTFSAALNAAIEFTRVIAGFLQNHRDGVVGRITPQDQLLMAIAEIVVGSFSTWMCPDGVTLSEQELSIKGVDERFKDVGATLRTFGLAMEQITRRSGEQ